MNNNRIHQKSNSNSSTRFVFKELRAPISVDYWCVFTYPKDTMSEWQGYLTFWQWYIVAIVAL